MRSDRVLKFFKMACLLFSFLLVGGLGSNFILGQEEPMEPTPGIEPTPGMEPTPGVYPGIEPEPYPSGVLPHEALPLEVAPVETLPPEEAAPAVEEVIEEIVPTPGVAEWEITYEEAAEQVITATAERISLDLRNINIIELFKILSKKTGLTIVPSKRVSGRVTLFLNNVTFEDALEVILVSQELACERKGNIINIMTADEYLRLYGQKYNEKREVTSFKLTYAKPKDVFSALGSLKSDIGKVIIDEATGTVVLMDVPEKLELMEKTAKDLDHPLPTELFDLRYAKAKDLKAQISDTLTTGPGTVTVDERTNKVIVTDLPDKMKKIKQMIKSFDEETRQVFIEAEIIELKLSDNFERGVAWERIFKRLYGLDLVWNFPIPNLGNYYHALSAWTLGKDDVELLMLFLQTIGETKIIANPRIAVVNNEEAKIHIGTSEPYSVATTIAAEETLASFSIEFVDVGVMLNVIPTIHKDGFVTMKVKPEISERVGWYEPHEKVKVPIIDKTEVETVVKVRDGATIVIAGLRKEKKEKKIYGVPFLCKLPVIGAFFGSKSRGVERMEIIIFLTPHIISGIVEEVEIAPPKMILKKEPKGMRE